MTAALVPLLVALAGGAVAFVVVRRHGWATGPSVAAAVALAPGVGFGLLSLAFFFWVVAGLAPPAGWILAALAGALAIALAAPRFRGGAPPHIGTGPTGHRPSASRAALWVVIALAGICLGLLLWTFPQAAAAQPFGGWDAWAIWNVRSLQLYRSAGDLDQIYARLRHGHPDYPLMLPGALAAQYCLLGREDVAIPQVTGLVFALGAGAVLFVAAWRAGSAVGGGAAVAVLWSTPAFWRWAFAQYADIPLSYLLLAAAAALASQLEAEEARRLPPVLAGFCFGLLTWMKNEGLIQALLLAAAFGMTVLATSRPLKTALGTLGRLPWIAAGALPALVALGLFKSHWSPVNETARFLSGASAKLTDLDRWRPVLTAFAEQLNPWSGIALWGLLWPFVAVCGVLFWRRRAAAGAPLVFLGVALILIWAAWLVVYVCTPASQVWHLNSSLHRLLLQLTPLTLAWALAGAGRPAQEPAAETPA